MLAQCRSWSNLRPTAYSTFLAAWIFCQQPGPCREEWMRKVWSAVVRSSRLLQQLDDTVVQLRSGGECNSICKQGQRRGAASAARWPVACFQAETGHNLFHSPCLPHIGMGGMRSGQNLQAVHTFVLNVDKFAPNCVFILDIGLRFEFANNQRAQKLAPCKNLFVSSVCGFYQQLLLSVIARGNCHQSLLASLS